MIDELEKKAMKLEREFERAPSFQRQKELNTLWDQIHQLYVASVRNDKNKEL